MDCHLIAHRNIAERYLLGSLPPEQQLLYEQHFFECDGCFSELQRLRAIRAALQSAPAEVPKRRRGFGYFGRWWRWPAIATAAASVVGVALLLRQHETFVPLREELSFIDDYLDIEVARFGPDKLQFFHEVDEETLDSFVPSMLLQELVCRRGMLIV